MFYEELGVILPVSDSLMYYQESSSEISNYIGDIPAFTAGMVTSDTESLRLTWWLQATTLLFHQISDMFKNKT